MSDEVRGMTTNERLGHFGLFAEWDAAVIARDSERMVSTLMKAQFTKDEAAWISATVLKSPSTYGF